MNCIILAGGMGTRLRSVVSDRPKPLAQIDGTPFLDILIDQIKNCGYINKVILATGYMSDQIKQYYENQKLPFEIYFSNETEPLGTGGAIKNALPFADSEDILVINGDSFLDINLNDFVRHHKEKSALISMATTFVNQETRYGFIEIDQESKVKNFQEKPQTPKNGWINCGIYIIRKELVKNTLFSGHFSLEKDFFPLHLGSNTYAYHVSGTFIDIGTPESYMLAQSILSKK